MKNLKGKVLGFLQETLTEMRKVTWPDRKYVTTATIIVLVLVVITALFLMFVDYGLTKIFGILIR